MRGHLLVVLLSCALVLACDDDSSSPPQPEQPLAFQPFQRADLVIGQFDMLDGRDDAGTGAIGPYGFNDVAGAPSSVGGTTPLYIADMGHNRIVGYKSFPIANGRPFSFVIGQEDFYQETYGRSASRFMLAARCFASQRRLYVVDQGNSRVLVWNSLPTSNRPADVVVGQDDFDSLNTTPDAAHFLSPSEVMEVGGKLFVLDSGHYRVLIYNSIPDENGAAANVVVGQAGFDTGDPGSGATGFGLAPAFFTDGRRLAVCDAVNDRVMIWNHIPTANGVAADIVLGAPDFNTAGSSTPSATSIGKPFGIAWAEDVLFVADHEFNRVLVYAPFPTNSFAPAGYSLGQSSFANSIENDNDQNGVVDDFPDARAFYQPSDVSVIGRRLLVADEGNNRVLVFEPVED